MVSSDESGDKTRLYSYLFVKLYVEVVFVLIPQYCTTFNNGLLSLQKALVLQVLFSHCRESLMSCDETAGGARFAFTANVVRGAEERKSM